jgi:hypothetical protein
MSLQVSRSEPTKASGTAGSSVYTSRELGGESPGFHDCLVVRVTASLAGVV